MGRSVDETVRCRANEGGVGGLYIGREGWTENKTVMKGAVDTFHNELASLTDSLVTRPGK